MVYLFRHVVRSFFSYGFIYLFRYVFLNVIRYFVISLFLSLVVSLVRSLFSYFVIIYIYIYIFIDGFLPRCCSLVGFFMYLVCCWFRYLVLVLSMYRFVRYVCFVISLLCM